MKIFVFVAALLIGFPLSLSTGTVKAGQKISFDSSNKEFIFPSNGLSNNIYLFLLSHENNEAPYDTKITCPYYRSTSTGSTTKEYAWLINNWKLLNYIRCKRRRWRKFFYL